MSGFFLAEMMSVVLRSQVPDENHGPLRESVSVASE